MKRISSMHDKANNKKQSDIGYTSWIASWKQYVEPLSIEEKPTMILCDDSLRESPSNTQIVIRVIDDNSREIGLAGLEHDLRGNLEMVWSTDSKRAFRQAKYFSSAASSELGLLDYVATVPIGIRLAEGRNIPPLFSTSTSHYMPQELTHDAPYLGSGEQAVMRIHTKLGYSEFISKQLAAIRPIVLSEPKWIEASQDSLRFELAAISSRTEPLSIFVQPPIIALETSPIPFRISVHNSKNLEVFSHQVNTAVESLFSIIGLSHGVYYKSLTE